MDWKSIENDREKYAAYLCSREWSLLKKKVHKRSGGVCERCTLNPGDAVHHTTYERKYREELDDLQHLCRGCHSFIHGESDADPIVVSLREFVTSMISRMDEHHLRHLCGFMLGDLFKEKLPTDPAVLDGFFDIHFALGFARGSEVYRIFENIDRNTGEITSAKLIELIGKSEHWTEWLNGDDS